MGKCWGFKAPKPTQDPKLREFLGMRNPESLPYVAASRENLFRSLDLHVCTSCGVFPKGGKGRVDISMEKKISEKMGFADSGDFFPCHRTARGRIIQLVLRHPSVKSPHLNEIKERDEVIGETCRDAIE